MSLKPQKINIIFIPISIIEGMAGTKRLQNFAMDLSTSSEVVIRNIIIDNERKKKEINKIINLNNYETIYLKKSNPLTWINYFLMINYYLIKFRKYRSNNIIYHYGYPNFQNLGFLLFAKMVGYKIVFDIVEDNSKIETFNSFISKIRIKSSNALVRKIRYLADGVIVISTHLHKKLTDIGIAETKLVHIPISVNFDKFKKRLEIKERNEIKIFYGGSFGEKDGIKYLLEAFDLLADKLPKVRLVLSGKASKKDNSKFVERLNALRNKNKVTQLGFLDDTTYYSELCSADILCMLRVNSQFANAGFPFKLGEMLATGNPVIATKVGDIHSYLSVRSAMLIQPESVDEIVNAIEKLTSFPQFRNTIGENGKIIAKKYFDSKILTNELKRFLYNL